MKASFQWVSLLVSGVAVVLSVCAITSSKKTAYVRSQDLIYKYQGMIDAKAAFEAKRSEWQANIDTLKHDFDNNVEWLRANHKELTESEVGEKKQFLRKQQDDIIQYTEQMQIKAEEEENELLQGVLNQVNAFAEEYGKREGYDLIFGTTLSGSILYGNDVNDITEDLLTELNKQYRGRGSDE